jgi:phage terminase small subunit
MKSNVTRLTPPDRQTIPAPPHLDAPEKKLWQQIVGRYQFDDGSLAILEEAMSARQRARRCREAVDRDGETMPDRWGVQKVHPLLVAERDSRTQFLTAMRALHLDVPEGK